MYFSDVQIRLIILYALKAFEISMPVEKLQEVLVWSGIIDYFTMMDFLLDMKSMGMIKDIEIEGSTCYDITEKGEGLASMFNDKIPLSVREHILDSARQVLDNIERGREIVADIMPVDTGQFLAKCGIYERGTPLFEVNLFAGSRKNAKEIAERFKKDAAQLYKIILERIVE
jgi:predicted transcriptional regulator